MQLVYYPNDILRYICKPVSKVTPELVDIAKQMYKVMIENRGVGLAAPQVGLDFRLIVLDNSGIMIAMFNPTILRRSQEKQIGIEGCLSFPNVHRIIKRPLEVIVKYKDVNNKMKHEVYKGLLARAIIHELEHLNGKLFIDLEEIT